MKKYIATVKMKTGIKTWEVNAEDKFQANKLALEHKHEKMWAGNLSIRVKQEERSPLKLVRWVEDGCPPIRLNKCAGDIVKLVAAYKKNNV